MTCVSFTVHGKPQPKQRARKGPNGWYTPDATREFEERVRMSWIVAGRPAFGEQVVELRIDVHSHSRRGDGDNVYKSCADSLNGLAYKDDKQIVTGGFRLYSCTREEQRVVVTLSTATDEGAFGPTGSRSVSRGSVEGP